jgi:very-short-patch-repair endonuclease
MSRPEVLLWVQIRKRLQGQFRFRRQHPFGRYILDFYCPELTLAVEVDGQVHDTGDHPQRDRYRDQWLATQGIKTPHIPATEVLNNMDGVISMILLAANQRVDPLRPCGPLPPEGEDLGS